jgi:DNA-binding transcriptional LysR family regulator
VLTVKQVQTFFWVARLGTVSKAAEKLHITQSAATKRLQELEAVAAVPLFEGGGRKSRLTPKGQELFVDSERLLELLEELERLKSTTETPARTLRIGLTELIALTWFPSFLKQLKALHPSITVEPEIDQSSVVRRKMEEGTP